MLRPLLKTLEELKIRINSKNKSYHLFGNKADPVISEAIEKHQEKAFSSENINFLNALNKLSKEGSDADLIQGLQDIYDTYIKEGAVSELNFDAIAIMKPLRKSFDIVLNPGLNDDVKSAAIANLNKQLMKLAEDTARLLERSVNEHSINNIEKFIVSPWQRILNIFSIKKAPSQPSPSPPVKPSASTTLQLSTILPSTASPSTNKPKPLTKIGRIVPFSSNSETPGSPAPNSVVSPTLIRFSSASLNIDDTPTSPLTGPSNNTNPPQTMNLPPISESPENTITLQNPVPKKRIIISQRSSTTTSTTAPTTTSAATPTTTAPTPHTNEPKIKLR